MTELYHTLHYTTTLHHAFVAVHNGTILHTQIRIGLCHARLSCVNCYTLFPYSFSTMGQPMSTNLCKFRIARWVLHRLPSYTICECVTHILSVSLFLNTCGVAYFLPCRSGTNTNNSITAKHLHTKHSILQIFHFLLIVTSVGDLGNPDQPGPPGKPC